jgi:zinc/manganese transport system substrate-binding protein
LPASAQQEAAKLKVVATFSILADFAGNVGGDRVEVRTLVGANGDVHVYSPTAADAEAIRNARLVIVNGRGLEGWLPRLVKSSGGNATTVVATHGIVPRKIAAGEMLSRDRGAGAVDPHAWQSVANAEIYVASIRDAMVAADPADAATYRANASAYLAKLEALDHDVRATLAPIPAQAQGDFNSRCLWLFRRRLRHHVHGAPGRFDRSRAERAGYRNLHHADQEREDSGGLPGERERPQTHAPNCL